MRHWFMTIARKPTFIITLFVVWRAEQDVVLVKLSMGWQTGYKEALALMVSFCTHDSCAAYATPPVRGR